MVKVGTGTTCDVLSGEWNDLVMKCMEDFKMMDLDQWCLSTIKAKFDWDA